MNLVISVIVGLVALVIGLFAGYVLRKSIGEKEIGSAEQKAQNILLDAETSAENKQKEMILEAKEEAHKLRSDVEKEIRDRRNEINKTEKRIQGKEENIDRKMNSIERREQELTKKEHSMQEKHKEIDEYLQKHALHGASLQDGDGAQFHRTHCGIRRVLPLHDSSNL